MGEVVEKYDQTYSSLQTNTQVQYVFMYYCQVTATNAGGSSSANSIAVTVQPINSGGEGGIVGD